jgi:hypothetical protein
MLVPVFSYKTNRLHCLTPALAVVHSLSQLFTPFYLKHEVLCALLRPRDGLVCLLLA